MDLLLLGGTGFLSRAVAETALARGHAVVTLTRGISGSPPPGAHAVHADRESADEMERALRPVRAEAVIDMSGKTATSARIAADLLADVRSYVYVSSLDAYRHWPPGPINNEADPLCEEESTDYGPAKAASERILGEVFGDLLLAARAGVIVGPGEVAGRLTSWLHRIARGGRVVVPDALGQSMAFVDARDFAGWLVDAAERGLSGPVNATGASNMTTYGGVLKACQDAVLDSGGPPSELVPVAEAVLLTAGVQPWKHLPFWVPAEVARTFWQIDTTTARQLGLPSRTVEHTVQDTWDWIRQAGPAALRAGQSPYGLPPELEQVLLKGCDSR